METSYSQIYCAFLFCNLVVLGGVSAATLRIYPGYAPFTGDKMDKAVVNLAPQRSRAVSSYAKRPAELLLPRGYGAGMETPQPSGEAIALVERFKSVGFRRMSGSTDDCATYSDCREQLLSYFDRMAKLSNRG